MATVNCPYCPFGYETNEEYAAHILRRHKNEGAFFVRCSFNNCDYTSQNWHNYRQHWRRQHGSQRTVMFTLAQEGHSVDIEMPEQPPDQDIPIANNRSPVCEDSLHAAKFLLHLENRNQLTRSGAHDLTGALGLFLGNVLDNVEKDIKAEIGDSNQEVLARCGRVISKWKCHDLLSLGSAHMRRKMYQTHFAYIEPQSVYLGKVHISDPKCGRKVSQSRYGYIIPIMEWVKALMSIPQIAEFAAHESVTRAGVLSDFSSGSYIRQHDLYGRETPFLQFIIGYDDLELQNPLRANKNHKLAMFYFTLANIPPRHRSKLDAIFPFAICRSSHVRKFGLGRILKDFTATITELQGGKEITVGSQNMHITGDLIAALCDTPAAALLGGFKESSSFAWQSCRMCDCDNEFAKSHFEEDDFTNRDMARYLEQCKTLETLDLERHRTHWSKHFGINRRSVLCEIPNFPVTSNLLQDPMHCILEGVFPYTAALLLQHLITVDKLFTLGEFNSEVQNFPYSEIDRGNKPTTFELKQINQSYHLKMKAASSLMAVYIFPLILGKFTDQNHKQYSNFLLLVRIAQLSFSPFVDSTSAAVLGQLVHDFCRDFEELYPGHNLRPKFHFLVHLPSQLLKFGPLRFHSTMRFEAKHGFFKDHRWKNFNNLPLSLLRKHQLHFSDRCTKASGELVDNLFPEGMGGRGAAEEAVDECELPECLQQSNQRYTRAESWVFKEQQWRVGYVMLLSDTDCENPSFGVLKTILISDSACIYVVYSPCEVIDFLGEFNAFQVHELNVSRVTKFTSLINTWPLPKYNVCGKILITNQFSAYNPFM